MYMKLLLTYCQLFDTSQRSPAHSGVPWTVESQRAQGTENGPVDFSILRDVQFL